jgi:transposase
VAGGGSVMVWAAFGSRCKTELIFVEGRQNSSSYIKLLQNHLVPNGVLIGGPNRIFQQDNSSVHASEVVRNWFREHGIRILDWPSISPDLDPIENLWGILVRLVYPNGRKYNTVPELKRALLDAWYQIESSVLKKLVESMHKRLIEVLKKNGRKVHY